MSQASQLAEHKCQYNNLKLNVLKENTYSLLILFV